MSGVSDKIIRQLSTWHSFGHNTLFYSLSTSTIYSFDKLPKNEVPPNHTKSARFITLMRMFLGSSKLKKIILSHQIDIVYCREIHYTPFLKKAFKSVPLILEINSDSHIENRKRSFFNWFYHLLTANKLATLANGIVTVTEELKRSIPCSDIPIRVIPNGATLTGRPSTSSSQSTRPKAIMLASGSQYWQGIDKVEKLAQILADIDFYIIGVKRANTKNLYYTSYLTGSELDSLISKADVGISTLALHRKGMNDACPLKSRTYMSRGLPFIYAYNDPDIADEHEYFLKIPNTEDNIEQSALQIRDFIKMATEHRNQIRNKVFSYGASYISQTEKEKERLAFFDLIRSAELND